MLPAHTHSTRRYLLWLGLIFVLVAGAFALRLSFPTSAQLTTPTYAAFPKDAPAPTDADFVTAQKGFQYLVSYTSEEFAPKTLSVKQGETVRFTNNSNSVLPLSVSIAEPVSLNHGEYFEYTFNTTGIFTYTGVSGYTGEVTVE